MKPKSLREETYRHVGAICNAGNWMEYQLEQAVSELARTDNYDDTQGERWLSLVNKLKALLKDGAVVDAADEAALRDLLSRIKAAMRKRDMVVHSTWLEMPKSTPSGHITGQRWRTRGVELHHWTLAELEQVHQTLKALELELSTTAWNAVMPPDQRF